MPKPAAPTRTTIQVRVSAADLLLLREAAERARRTLSDWLRLACIDAARAQQQR